MNAMRIGLFCALVGWMAADAQAQLGTYGSPDPIPLGQVAPRDAYMPVVATRTSYVTPADGAGPNLAPYGSIPQPPSESAAVQQMLNAPTPTVGPAAGPNAMPAGNFMNEGGGAPGIPGPGTCGGNCGGCGDACCCGNGCCSPWYASFDALYMTRTRPRNDYTSYEWGIPDHQGQFSDVDWTWGGEVAIGYRFGCCCEWGVEGTYWGLAESSTDGAPNCPGPYGTPFTMGLTSMLSTTGGLITAQNPTGLGTADQWTDDSPDHHIWRTWDAQDVEFNVVRSLCGGQCNCLSVDFLAGVRWFRFQDGLIFGAERNLYDNSIYAGTWLYLNDHITNDLVGGQAGFKANFRFANCWKVFFIPTVGVYNNHMTMDYNVYAVGNGTQYQATSQTYSNPNYPVHATQDGFAVLAQFDLGLDWQITQHISTQFGYRVVAATGLGLSDSQIPAYGNDTQAIGDIQHDDSLVLHGAFAGLTFTW